MNLDEKMILLATAFLFLPYQIASVAVACVLIQALCRHKLVDIRIHKCRSNFSFIALSYWNLLSPSSIRTGQALVIHGYLC